MLKLITEDAAPLNLCQLTIKGERIMLCSVTEHDIDSVFNYFNEDIIRYMMPAINRSIEGTRTFITSSIDKMRNGIELVCSIRAASSNEFLGICGIHETKDPMRPELGVWVKKDAHGNGYGKEAIQTLFSWMKQHIEFDKALYPVDKDNIPSCKIPESLGGKVASRETKISGEGYSLNKLNYEIPNQ